MDFERVAGEVSRRMSKKRFEHTLGVAKKAKELAVYYDISWEKAYFAGLIHDIAKEIPKEEMLEYVIKFNLELDEMTKNSTQLMHAPVGAVIAREEFDCDDDVYNSIYYHTVGRINMSMLEKIIFVSDSIEENRIYEDVDKLRDLAYTDLDLCIVKTIDYTLNYLIKKGKPIHKNTVLVRNYILERGNI